MWVLAVFIACPACLTGIAVPFISLRVQNAAARVSVFNGCILLYLS